MISSQLFDRILGVGHLAVDADRKGAVLPVGCRRAPDRRAATRIPFGQRALICRDRGRKAGTWETIMMQDISLMGFGLLSHIAMEEGETFVLKVTDRDQQIIRIRCEVKRCERGGIGGVSYLVGATFEQVIQHKTVQIHDEEDAVTWSEEELDPAAAASGDSVIRNTGAAVGRAAASFFKALDPSQWLKRADDYSSIG